MDSYCLWKSLELGRQFGKKSRQASMIFRMEVVLSIVCSIGFMYSFYVQNVCMRMKIQNPIYIYVNIYMYVYLIRYFI